MRVVQISESVFTVQGHGVHTAFLETVNALKKMPDIEVLVNSRVSADICHIHTVGFYALKHLLFAKGYRVVSAHIVPESLIGSLRWAKSWVWLARWYLRFFYNHADLVIAVSQETKELLRGMGVKRPITVINNMIDISRYANSQSLRSQARHHFGWGSDDWVVVSNGQVQPRKRVDTFLRLAKKFPKTRFVWVGGIPFKGAAAGYEKMKKLMDSAPKNLLFTGVVDREVVADYVRAADVFVMPSEQETFGLAIVEAAAAGLPLVLRDIHDYDNTFRNDAVICRDTDFEAALDRLQTDKVYYGQMQEKALAMAARYDSMKLVQRLVSVYRDLSVSKESAQKNHNLL